jgi:hypothetical protein
VRLGEPRRINAQELLEVLLDEPEERGLPRPNAAGTPAHRSPRQPTCRRERPARIKDESSVCSGEKSLRRARAETGPHPGLGDFGGLGDNAQECRLPSHGTLVSKHQRRLNLPATPRPPAEHVSGETQPEEEGSDLKTPDVVMEYEALLPRPDPSPFETLQLG